MTPRSARLRVLLLSLGVGCAAWLFLVKTMDAELLRRRWR